MKTTFAITAILQLLSSPVLGKLNKPRSLSAKMPKGTKSAKSPKSAKSSGGSSNLIALVEPVGEDSVAIGTATISYNMDDSFLFALDMGGLTSDGTAAIAESCDGEEFGEWDGETNFYNALGEGISKSAFRYSTGYTAAETEGKAVVVYDDAGTVVGCGTLAAEKEDKVLMATMGRYPNYEGDIEAAGMVTVEYTSGDSFVFKYMLSGLEADCEGCGIHIHAGTSCETHELVKGHGWNSVVVQDLWTAAGGATYNTDSSGSAEGYFNMFNGYGYEENFHHAVVIHGQDGTRLGCGILM